MAEHPLAGTIARPREGIRRLGPQMRTTLPPAEESGDIRRATDSLALRLPRTAGNSSGIAVADLLAIVEGTRALVHATTVEDIVETCRSTVIRLGGTVRPARLAGKDAIPLDLSFGQGEPLLAIAPDRFIRRSLDAVLPDLMEDARATAVRVRRTGIMNDEAAVDSLTGLLNRRSIDRLLAHVRAGDVVIMIDLDDFKIINDTLGHAAGDVVLAAFATLLRQEGRISDRLGRLGGDEFVVVIPGGNRDEATTLLGRLRVAWDVLRPRAVGFSAGVAVAAGADGPEVIARADKALYRNKDRPDRRTGKSDRNREETA
jgi:diguanylate cyclase (GGDEF)-like protein